MSNLKGGEKVAEGVKSRLYMTISVSYAVLYSVKITIHTSMK
jgi:hypothetical protein